MVSGYRYDLNDAGHRLSVTEHEGRIVSYTYDDLYRLTEENINNGERVISYTFDNVGNRLSRTDSVEGITTYTYDDNDQLQTETLSQNGTVIDTTIYTYDDNGNLIQQVKNDTDTTTYTWNDDNRLVAVTLPDGSAVSYAYDDEGIRVSTTVDGNTTEYLIDKNRAYAQVLEEFVNDELATSYVYGHDLISQARGIDTSFYQVDGLGSTRVLTDELGSVTDTYDYDAFGNLIDSSGGTENSYQFAGEQFDENLDNYYLRQRFYDQSTGRFLRRDTYEGRLQEPLTLHKHLYVHSNPVNLIDPTGLYADTLQSQTAVFVTLATLSAIPALGLVTTQKPLPPLGGFGEGPRPVVPTHTGHSSLLRKILDFGRSGGFGEGVQPDVPTHTGHPKGNIEDLVIWVFPYDTKELRKNMGAAGRPVLSGDHAHHIVPGKMGGSAGAQARSILNSYGIDINNASNGVGLSRDAHLKRGYHKNAASAEVLSRIQNLPDAASVKTELENIGREMQNNTFKF